MPEGLEVALSGAFFPRQMVWSLPAFTLGGESNVTETVPLTGQPFVYMMKYTGEMFQKKNKDIDKRKSRKQYADVFHAIGPKGGLNLGRGKDVNAGTDIIPNFGDIKVKDGFAAE